MYVCTLSHSVMSDSWWPPWTVACQAPLFVGLSRQEYWSCHFLLQRIFPSQGLNLCLLHLLHWQQILLLLSHQGSSPFPYWLCWVTQSCLILCDPMYFRLPGSSVHRILQARILGWVAMPFFRGSSQPRNRTQVSHIAGGVFTVRATREAPLSDSDTQLIPNLYYQAQRPMFQQTFPIQSQMTLLVFYSEKKKQVFLS